MTSKFEELDHHLKMAFNAAAKLTQEFPDNDPNGIGRTLRVYTVPGIKQWIEGFGQAGNVRHLKELLGEKDV